MDCWPVQSELKGSPACAETSLLHARRPSLWTPLGVIPVASPSLRDRAASDQGPGQHAVLTGSSLHGGPPMEQTAQQRTYRSLCCTWYDAYVPAWHFTDGDVALLTEQARGGARQV